MKVHAFVRARYTVSTGMSAPPDHPEFFVQQAGLTELCGLRVVPQKEIPERLASKQRQPPLPLMRPPVVGEVTALAERF